LRERFKEKELSEIKKTDDELNQFSIKLIKVVGVVGTVLGLVILIAFWVWVIHWLYQVW
jgi:hypothetical protein